MVLPSWVLAIGKLIFSGILSFFKDNKAQEYKTEAQAAKEALKSVGDSLKVEDKIEKEQEKIEKEEQSEPDKNDAFNDGDWNNK